MSDELAPGERPCHYCGAECIAGQWYHTTDCPSTTGLFPIEEGDLAPFGMVCCNCSVPFEVGDFFVHRTIHAGTDEPGFAGAAVVDVVCIGCGMVPVEDAT